MSHSWHRLDGGWEWYAAEDIHGHYGRAMNLLDRMVAVLREMDEALVKTADLIEQADLAAAALFELSAVEGQPGGREGAKDVPQPPEELEPWQFAEDEDWPNTNIPVYLDGKVWLVNNDLRDALNDPNASLSLIEDFYRWVVAPGLVAKGAPDAAEMLLRSLDGKTSDYQVSERLGKELMALPDHVRKLHEQELLAMDKIRQDAETIKPGEVRPLDHSSDKNGMTISAYDPDEHPNSTFAMADYAGWFTWQGKIERGRDGTWIVRGTLNRDLADYSDWHGSPHDYDGDGDKECPGAVCGKTASFDLAGLDPETLMSGLPQELAPLKSGLHDAYEQFIPPGQNTRITIPDEWMARLVIGGEASKPGFKIFFNAQEDFEFTVTDWSSSLPSIEYQNLRCGDQYRLPGHETTPGFEP